MVFFIAEVSSNHSKDINRCLEFIDTAASIGCNSVKFQLFKVDKLFAPEILKRSKQHRLRKKWELPAEFLPILRDRCNEKEIQLSCTPFYLEAVEELQPHVDFYKISSYELTWDDLLIECARTCKPLILSTGMADLDEIRHAVDLLRENGCDNLTLLHCVSAYPTHYRDANLAAIDTLSHVTGCKVGWSDHSVDAGVIHRAVHRWGADVIEFHLDLDGCGDEFEAGHCWLPQQIGTVIEQVRHGEAADGSGIKEPVASEIADRMWRADPSDGLRPLKQKRFVDIYEDANSDKSLPSVLLVCHASATIGLGHLARLLALAQALRKADKTSPEFLIFGDPVGNKELAPFNPIFLPLSKDFNDSVKARVEILKSHVVVFDLYPELISPSQEQLFKWLKKSGLYLVGIDALVGHCQVLDLTWVPSICFNTGQYENCAGRLKSGWDSLLIQKRLPTRKWEPGRQVLVLTGGGDTTHLGRTLPGKLESMLESGTHIHWVCGPYSEPPIVPIESDKKWIIHSELTQLDELIVKSNYVLTVFGVSFFEVLQYGIPTVVFSPYKDRDEKVLFSLAEQEVAVVANDSTGAVQSLKELMRDDELGRDCSQTSLEKLSVKGAEQLAKRVNSLAGI